MHSRSPHLAAAARLIGLNWAYTLQGPALAASYFVAEVAVTIGFYQISKNRWFPVPLVCLHGVLAVYHFYTVFLDPNNYWVIFALNRLFELEMIYIIACSIFRIRSLSGKQTGRAA